MSHLMNANLRIEAIESFESALASSVACRKTNHLSEREFHRTSAGTGSQEFQLLTSPGKLAGTKKPQGCAGPDQKWASKIFKIDSVLFFHFNCAGISSFIYHGIQKPKSQTPRKNDLFPKKSNFWKSAISRTVPIIPTYHQKNILDETFMEFLQDTIHIFVLPSHRQKCFINCDQKCFINCDHRI
jgi:hypothetical protein